MIGRLLVLAERRVAVAPALVGLVARRRDYRRQPDVREVDVELAPRARLGLGLAALFPRGTVLGWHAVDAPSAPAAGPGIRSGGLAGLLKLLPEQGSLVDVHRREGLLEALASRDQAWGVASENLFILFHCLWHELG